MKVLSVFGTRPEAIKMAPVVRLLDATSNIESMVCVTGQHREMLTQVVELFDLKIDLNLDVMTHSQSLTGITTSVLEGLAPVLNSLQPDWVLVHGDTTTTMAASLAAYYHRIPVGHVEAGLRTGNIYSPWPEEINRSIAGRIATAHFAPTQIARANLLAENISPENIIVTGNTVIDALHWVREHRLGGIDVDHEMATRFPFLDSGKRLVLVTGHRRESFDGGLARTCEALCQLAARGDVQIVYPVHLNPIVQRAAESTLAGVDDVHLIEPLDYLPFVWLMDRSYLIVSDSGGVQEEAPALGVPVLVTRETTERPEAVLAGAVELVGTDSSLIFERASRLLDDPKEYSVMSSAESPYGDGLASKRVVKYLTEHASTSS